MAALGHSLQYAGRAQRHRADAAAARRSGRTWTSTSRPSTKPTARVRAGDASRAHRRRRRTRPGRPGRRAVNQFPRAMDIARPLSRGRRAGGHRRLPRLRLPGHAAGLPPELQEAQDLGVTLFAGEAEGRFDDAASRRCAGALKPLYNYIDDLPGLEGAAMPFLPRRRSSRTSGAITSFDAGRGCPFQCSFCTIINVQGRKSRHRSADDVERDRARKTARRASSASSSPTTISPATRTGRRFSTA